MHNLHPELTAAMSTMLDKIDASLGESVPADARIIMYLAGGMAVHYHCGTRYTNDVDATFSHRLLLDGQNLTVSYTRQDGRSSAIYFDFNYNDTFALIHPDYKEDAVEWEGIGNENRRVKLHVLTPVDLAVSKVARYSPQDQEDISALSAHFDRNRFLQRTEEALDYYVGDTRWIRQNINMIAETLTT